MFFFYLNIYNIIIKCKYIISGIINLCLETLLKQTDNHN